MSFNLCQYPFHSFPFQFHFLLTSNLPFPFYFMSISFSRRFLFISCRFSFIHLDCKLEVPKASRGQNVIETWAGFPSISFAFLSFSFPCPLHSFHLSTPFSRFPCPFHFFLCPFHSFLAISQGKPSSLHLDALLISFKFHNQVYSIPFHFCGSSCKGDRKKPCGKEVY